MNIPRTSITDIYNAARINSVADDVNDFGARIQALETQVVHLRTLNRALVEYLAAQSGLTPQALLDHLSHQHPDQPAAETLHCKSCGTVISRDSKACYSCGRKIDADVYILG